MRLLRLSVTMAFVFCLGASASAVETRIFIISNQADGYGIDQCLSSGERCGTVVANAYCQAQNYAEVRSYRKIEREEITGAVPVNKDGACRGACNAFAIECVR